MAKRTIFLPIKPPGLNGAKGLMRMHWKSRVRIKIDIHLSVLHALGGDTKRIDGPVRVNCTMLYASVPRDWDNLAVAAKYPMDSIVRLGVLEDDSPSVIESMTHRQRKVKTLKEEGYMIEIEQCP